MALDPLVRASVVTVLGLIFIPWLITDTHWRNVLLGFVGLYVLYIMTESDEMAKPGKKAVLITGCDTGMGHGMAKYFDRQGFRVFAGCLVSEGEGAKSLQTSCSDRLNVLQLDISKDQEVEDALEAVKEKLDGEGLWGLVNNAGILQFAEVELTPLSVFQQHFDVNCLGQVRMVKAFLPLLKKAKGRIVNFASINAHMYMSMFGAYCMSKAAVELFSDVLRLEMIKWRIKVSIIYPAGFDTNMTRYAGRQEKYFNEIQESLSKSQKMYFNDIYFKKVLERSSRLQNVDPNSGYKHYVSPSDLSPVYHAVDHALLSKTPRAHYPAGKGARFMIAFLTYCPSWITDFLFTATTYTYREKDMQPLVNMTFD